MSLSENLYHLRKKHKITQEELADRLGVSRQSVSKWETGEASPETDKLIALSDFFGVSLDELVRSDLSGMMPDEREEAGEKKTDGAAFTAHMDKFSRRIAFGVFLILFGVAVCVLLGGVSCITSLSEPLSNLTAIMGGVAVILFVAAAVFLFVLSGLSHDKFKRENPAVEDNICGKEKTETFHKRFALAMACLVSGILLDVVFLVLMTAFIDNDIISVANKEAAMSYVISAFLFVLSFIVGGLVYFGVQRSKFDASEYNKQARAESSVNGRVCEALCGTLMLTATAIYLILGFVLSLWHPGWIIFPVGGIACGILRAICGIKGGDGDKKDKDD